MYDQKGIAQYKYYVVH